MKQVVYCKRCCQISTRPKIVFNAEGICGACQWEDEKKKINWEQREYELNLIASEAKHLAKSRGTYDCALGVSGGKDSTFTALYARDVLGLNCLLVSAFPDDITEEGKANFDNLINHGFDCVRIHVDPKLLASLMAEDFHQYLHFRKATEYPLWASTFTVAKEKNIPLVIQGENAALTLGVSEDMNTDWDASTIWKTNTIAGATAREHYPHIKPEYLIGYTFPDLSKWEGKAIWLNYFVKKWSQYGNAQFAIRNGMVVRSPEMNREFGHHYNSTCLDSPFHSVSQSHKFVKYGFGYETDAVCYDIREGRMTREEGFKMIDKLDGMCSDFLIDHLILFLGITRSDYDATVNKFVNRELVEWKADRWQLRDEIKALR